MKAHAFFSLNLFYQAFRKDNLAPYTRDRPSHYRWWQPIYIEPLGGGLENSGHLQTKYTAWVLENQICRKLQNKSFFVFASPGVFVRNGQVWY